MRRFSAGLQARSVKGRAERSGPAGRGYRCCRCRAQLGSGDVKVVISSRARGGANLPLGSRLVCADCFRAASGIARASGITDARAILNR